MLPTRRVLKRILFATRFISRLHVTKVASPVAADAAVVLAVVLEEAVDAARLALAVAVDAARVVLAGVIDAAWVPLVVVSEVCRRGSRQST